MIVAVGSILSTVLEWCSVGNAVMPQVTTGRSWKQGRAVALYLGVFLSPLPRWSRSRQCVSSRSERVVGVKLGFLFRARHLLHTDLSQVNVAQTVDSEIQIFLNQGESRCGSGSFLEF